MPNSATRSRAVPLHPRRVSGPARRPLTAGPNVRGRTSAFERIARIPDYRFVDRVLRSRGSIWLIGILLGGIVAMQVSLLRLNTGISRAITTQQTLEHQNQLLQKGITEASSAEMIRARATERGLIDPEAGNNRYLKSRGASDVVRADKRMTPPSAEAEYVMKTGGKPLAVGMTAEGALAALAAAETATNTAAPTGTAPATTAGVTPTSTAQPLPTPDATVSSTAPAATPTAVATPPAGTATVTATPPQG